MISKIGAIGNVNSSDAMQSLSPQTKILLESMGINTSNITTEAQGQTALKSAQGTQESQNSQQMQGLPPPPPPEGGNNSQMEAIKEEATSLAQKLGVSVSSADKINDIMDKISTALSKLESDAANNPQKTAQLTEYKTEFQHLYQSLSDAQSAMESSMAQAQVGANHIQSSMTGLASYNQASISISNANKIKF